MENIGNILEQMGIDELKPGQVDDYDCKRKICWKYRFEGVCNEGKTHYDETICSSMKNRIEELNRLANIPPIFKGIYLPSALKFIKNIKTFNLVKHYTDNLKENIRNGQGIIMKGNIGTGKTSLCSAILIHASLSRFSCYFADFYNDILNFYDLFPNQQERFEYFERMKNVDLLVVDDIVEPKQNLRSYEFFIGLINYRYNQNKATIINSNLDVKSKVDYMPERIKDRLRSKCLMLPFLGESLR